MTESRLRANLWRYQIFQMLITAFLFLPVIVLFWQENGLDPFDIYLLQGCFAIAVVVLEVPTGMVADRLGKRTSLIAATALIAAGMLVYSVGSSFAVFLFAEILLAFGASLVSGADSALLFDTLCVLNRKEEYKRLEGNARGLQMVSLAIFTILGGFVGEVSFRATMWLSAIGPLAAFVISLGFVEANPQQTTHGNNEKPSAVRSYATLIVDSLRFVLKHRLVRWYILFLALLSGSGTWLLWLYQPYMQFIGLPIYAFGLAFALFNLFAALMSGRAQQFDEFFGPTGTLLALVVLQIAPLVLMAFVIMPFGFLFILGHQAVRAISRPIISDRILQYTYADKRATVLSLGSLAGRLFFAVTAPLVGWITKTNALPTSLLVQGALIASLLLILVFAYRRIPRKYFEVKQSVLEQQ